MSEEKLKTLKDLQLEYTGDIQKLKIEAIRYIKYYRSLYPHNVQGASQIQFIKYFFNITEKDLK